MTTSNGCNLYQNEMTPEAVLVRKRSRTSSTMHTRTELDAHQISKLTPAQMKHVSKFQINTSRNQSRGSKHMYAPTNQRASALIAKNTCATKCSRLVHNILRLSRTNSQLTTHSPYFSVANRSSSAPILLGVLQILFRLCKLLVRVASCNLA